MYLSLIFFCIFSTYISGGKYVDNYGALNFDKQFKSTRNHTLVIATNYNNSHQKIKKSNEITFQNIESGKTINNAHVKKLKPKKPKKKRKVKRKEDITEEHKDVQILQQIQKSVATDSATTTARTTKRRRRKRRRRKKKQNRTDILEITTAKTINGAFKTVNNTTDMATLIEELNKNPGNDFSKINLNKTRDNKSLLSVNNTIKQVELKIDKNWTYTFNSTMAPKKRNRCVKNNGGCTQICREKGKHKCSCLKGYVLTKSRKKCVDIDECKFKNGGCKEICRNILGAYYCDCSSGFRISDDLKSCQDINECHLRNGHGPCQDTCTNTYGSFICDCSHLNGTRLGNDKLSCQDINECEEGISGCSHLCINTNLRAFCSCPEGMELMSDYKTCQDIDECEDTSIKNSCRSGCVNTIGSYYCEEPFQNDQSSNISKVPVCPPLNPPQLGFITCHRNSSSPFDTFDKQGRKIIKNNPGTKCFLVCPTGFKLVGSNRFVCGVSGKWIVKKQGFCTKAPYPKLECPGSQTMVLEEGQNKMTVTFPPPQTNIRWKIVKSYPKWAKNLKGELSEGHHHIQFSVTDPWTKLSSTCSFFITIRK